MILCDPEDLQEMERESDLYYQILGLFKNEIFLPSAKTSHTILTVTSKDIRYLTKFSIKIESDLVIKDWDQRQIPRFKYVFIWNLISSDY